MTTRTDRTEAADDLKRRPIRKRMLEIALAVLGAAVIVLGFLLWNAGSAMPAEVAQVVDDYNTALIDQDPEAWRATVSDDWYYSNKYYGPTGFLEEMSLDPPMNEYLRWIEFGPAFEYQQIGDPIVTGEGPWFVTMHQHWSDQPTPDARVKDYEGAMTYVIIEQDGAMKVAATYWTGSARFADE